MVAIRDDKASIIPIGKVHFVYQPCINIKKTAHFGDVSPQRHSSDGFMLNNGTIFDNKNFHQKSGPGWIQRAETQKFAEVQNDEDKPADWAATTATQLSWCPQITRTLHSFSESVFWNPTHHHTITTWREKLLIRTCGSPSFISLISPQFGDILPPSCATKGLWRHIFDRCTPAYLFENTHFASFCLGRWEKLAWGGALQ